MHTQTVYIKAYDCFDREILGVRSNRKIVSRDYRRTKRYLSLREYLRISVNITKFVIVDTNGRALETLQKG